MDDDDETIMKRPPAMPVRGTARLLCSVGRNGVNRAEDVVIIRAALGETLPSAPVPANNERRCDPDLIAAIEHYQSRILGMQPPFGRIDPGGTTIQALIGD